MRIGLLSDTHNRHERTRWALDSLLRQGAETFLHCGDFVNASILELFSGLSCSFVFGNNDTDSIPELRSVAAAIGAQCLDWGGTVELGGKKIAVTHGHLVSEWKRLSADQPDYLVFGHSHCLLDDRSEMTRHINPGALHRASYYSVALLDLDADELHFLEVPAIACGTRGGNRSP